MYWESGVGGWERLPMRRRMPSGHGWISGALSLQTVLVRSLREHQDPFSNLYLSFFFFFSFSLFLSFFPFFPVFALAKTSNTTLNKSDASGNHCLVSDLREKAFSLFSVHTTPYDVGCRFLRICFLSCWGSYFCLKFVESVYHEWMLSFTKGFSAFVS